MQSLTLVVDRAIIDHVLVNDSLRRVASAAATRAGAGAAAVSDASRLTLDDSVLNDRGLNIDDATSLAVLLSEPILEGLVIIGIITIRVAIVSINEMHRLRVPCHLSVVLFVDGHGVDDLMNYGWLIDVDNASLVNDGGVMNDALLMVQRLVVSVVDVLAALLDDVLNIGVTLISRVHHSLVSLSQLSHLAFVLQDAATLLTHELLLLLLMLPGLFLSTRVEEWLNFVFLVVELELLLTHVGMLDAELGEALIGIHLSLINIALLLGKGLIVLDMAEGQEVLIVSVAATDVTVLAIRIIIVADIASVVDDRLVNDSLMNDRLVNDRLVSDKMRVVMVAILVDGSGGVHISLSVGPVAALAAKLGPVLLVLHGLLGLAALLLLLPLALLVIQVAVIVLVGNGGVGVGVGVVVVRVEVAALSMGSNLVILQLLLALKLPHLVGVLLVHVLVIVDALMGGGGGVVHDGLVNDVIDVVNGRALVVDISLVLLPVGVGVAGVLHVLILLGLGSGGFLVFVLGGLCVDGRATMEPEFLIIIALLASGVFAVESLAVDSGRACVVHDRNVLRSDFVLGDDVLNGVSHLLGLVVGLHLEDEVASLDRDVLRVEDRRVGVEATRGLMPALVIEVLEIVAPVQLKFIIRLVVLVHLDVVVEQVPGHVASVKPMSP
mmetsp:Transcript_7162/g.9991  ORF Transcript_7162/g.9991 Transcript_7162/m.9991 type:complete len:665 (+) Transcript_7162:559-2553(+)